MTPGPIESLFRGQLLAWLADNKPQDGVRSAKNGDVAFATAQNLRSENEDRVFYAEFGSPRADRSFALLSVLDGIGGLSDGGECAEFAITAILAKLLVRRKANQRITLIEALASANDEVRRAYSGRSGVTFAGVFIQTKRAVALNVGDTRIYHFDESRGGLNRLSTDDRIGAQLAKVKGLENIDLDPELAMRLGQFLGMHDAIRPNVRMIRGGATRSSADYFLLATDGAYSVGETLILDAIKHKSEPKEIAKTLFESSVSDPAGDNATLACARADRLRAPNIAKSKDAEFEQLQVWTTEGSFTFLIPLRLAVGARRHSAREQRPRDVQSDRSSHVRLLPEERDRFAHQTTDEDEKEHSHAEQTVQPKEAPRADKPKRELLIQQLSFEDQDEAAE
jgi:PPM family protein phosphatase